jgi:hypothetical protein
MHFGARKHQVTVTVAAEATRDAAVLAMVVSASADSELCEATYLPAGMDEVSAREWLEACPSMSWVVWCDGEPCGFLGLDALRGSIGVVLPAATLEREVWLLHPWRGRGVIRAANDLVLPVVVQRGVRAILGVAWEENRAAVRGMERAGFFSLGRVWWDLEGCDPGWCEAWVLRLDRPVEQLPGEYATC